MSAVKTFFTTLRNDEDGASFLEYTVLLGIILAVSIATISSVGLWANGVWGTLLSTLPAAAS